MSVYDFLVDFAIASALILVGQFLRAKIKFFQEFFIPASMLAGFIGLLLGERFLNVVHFSSGASSYAGALIIVVFTVVGLNGFSKGQKGGADSTVKRVLSFTMYRNVIMFIQFALGIAVTLTVVTWLVPDINPGFGVLMASGFTGGHGTAAAVGSTFNDVYGWAEATDLGMTFATVGILSGVFGGLIWIKIATKKGWTIGSVVVIIAGILGHYMVTKGLPNNEIFQGPTVSSIATWAVICACIATVVMVAVYLLG